MTRPHLTRATFVPQSKRRKKAILLRRLHSQIVVGQLLVEVRKTSGWTYAREAVKSGSMWRNAETAADLMFRNTAHKLSTSVRLSQLKSADLADIE